MCLKSSWQSAIKNHFKNIMKTERVAAGNGTGGAAVVKPEIKRKCEENESIDEIIQKLIFPRLRSGNLKEVIPLYFAAEGRIIIIIICKFLFSALYK
ncbi:uncharacterized protein LOC117102742 isoform X2 [Anneissia japonica]|uniref:uncharacterized protein LOC117102742 isoform X2 n=1 Tax=Anneissia japonica TaxID=1529436 RepID=UPI0014255B85|nr:uncharacterized protein LOC117102742 isoform X2 [Anneissia japonica]